MLRLSVSLSYMLYFFFSSRRRHTRLQGDWSSDVCSSDLSQSLTSLESFLSCLSGRHEIGSRPGADSREPWLVEDRKSTRLNSSHLVISYAVFCLKKKKQYLTY